MACGGFTCSKNGLAALNVLYILVSFLLIGIGAYSKAATYFYSLPIMGGIITCGVLLFFLAVVGLAGAVKHHQVLLFFYMIVLFLLFLVQFSVACACLAFNRDQQQALALGAWNKGSDSFRNNVQDHFDCCAFQDFSLVGSGDGYHPPCNTHASCCDESSDFCCTGDTKNGTIAETTCPSSCVTCWTVSEQYMDQAFKASGGIGLFFSFTEIMGVWLTIRFRNAKDPRANPSAFL